MKEKTTYKNEMAKTANFVKISVFSGFSD